MNSFVDLHCHSTNSDGKYEIQTVINMARASNIKYLAVTDHNTLMPNFDLYQKRNPDMVLIRGSEISAIFQFSSGKSIEIHIVGLFLDNAEEIEEILKNNHKNNKEWIKKIIFNLNKIGLEVGTYEEIQKDFPGRQIRRMLLAEFMVKKGITPSVDVALNKYIGDRGERLAWEPCRIEYAPFTQVIDAIHRAKGLAILAHPMSYVLTEMERQELLKNFKATGGDAIEVLYAAYSEEQRTQLKLFADALELGYSCGSDFHGFSTTETMENHFPSEIYYQLLRKKKML